MMRRLIGILLAVTVVLPGTVVWAQTATPADPTVNPTALITGLWKTGVDASGIKLATGQNDPHWTLTSIGNPVNGQPHCQSGTTPRPALVVGSNVLMSDGVSRVWPFSPADANWLGANPEGLHNTSVACPDPSDESAGTIPTAGEFPDHNTWPFWNYTMLPFKVHESIDPDSITLTASGLADNLAEVSVNGTKIMDLTASITGYTSATPTSSQPVSGVFKQGDNDLTVRVQSGYSNSGFILSELTASAKYYPKLLIAKAISTQTLTVGDKATYTIVVKNSGTTAQPYFSDTSGTITVSDSVPDNFTLGDIPAGCTAQGQAVTCTSTTVLKGDGSNSWTIALPVTAKTVGKGIVNTAYVKGGGSTNCVADKDCPAPVAADIVPTVPNTGIGELLTNPLMILVIGGATAVAAYYLLGQDKVMAWLPARFKK
jgi:uncharacterized repeat protein (TIGR01451 family)